MKTVIIAYALFVLFLITNPRTALNFWNNEGISMSIFLIVLIGIAGRCIAGFLGLLVEGRREVAREPYQVANLIQYPKLPFATKRFFVVQNDSGYCYCLVGENNETNDCYASSYSYGFDVKIFFSDETPRMELYYKKLPKKWMRGFVYMSSYSECRLFIPADSLMIDQTFKKSPLEPIA